MADNTTPIGDQAWNTLSNPESCIRLVADKVSSLMNVPIGKLVGVSNGTILVGFSYHQPPVHQALQPLRQEISWYVLIAFLKRFKSVLVVPHQVASHEQRPLVAQEFHQSRNGATRPELVAFFLTGLTHPSLTHRPILKSELQF